MSLQMTTWQTVGPFFHIGLERLFAQDISGEGAEGERMEVAGRVLDGDGLPIPDAAVEIWQANTHGKYAHPDDTRDLPLEQGFRGFGRIPTDDDGCFRFTTIKPGVVPGPEGMPQAPHLVVGVLMRGLLKGLVTRLYFAGDARNEADPILQLVPAERRHTLLLTRAPDSESAWQCVLRMQGEEETVFLDF